MVFKDREEAGRLLFLKLREYSGNKNMLIMALPRGGVVVGKVVSEMLHLPLDILVIRKIGAPQNPELAIGAVGPEKTTFWDEEIIEKLNLRKKQKEILKKMKFKERADLENVLRNDRKHLTIKDKTVIVIDDGVATGATVLCAQKYLKKRSAKQVILAVPVISPETLKKISLFFDKIITLAMERKFFAVGQFYRKFPQVENEEVRKILNKSSN
ncbi:MAG: phosphoribosyltransferase [Patescibacteria group bacterium]|nr:phosphoribosyltransferase [Patescibacteria group bacterium]